MAKIYYVGDWAVMTGPVFSESPFNHACKGLEIFNYGKWLKEGLETEGRHDVTSVPAWDFYMMGPGEYEKILGSHDVLIFSDVEAKNFQLSPAFFDRKKFGDGVLTFPDRIRLTLEAVDAGTGLLFLGGWLSFSGELGKAGWNRTRFREILPVRCLDHDDLIESTEGFTAGVTDSGRDLFPSINWKTFPPILGYNKTVPIHDGRVLLKVEQTGDPLAALRECGRGRVLAYMSDPAPHWGCNFVFWKHYAEFWSTCVSLVLPD
jgi:uncharacterized membrane protein